MNANELSRLLFNLKNIYSNYEQVSPQGAFFLKQSMDVLRQLQAENETLKDKLHNVIIRSSKQVAEFENQIEELRGMLTNRDEIIDLRKAQEK